MSSKPIVLRTDGTTNGTRLFTHDGTPIEGIRKIEWTVDGADYPETRASVVVEFIAGAVEIQSVQYMPDEPAAS